MSNSSFLMFLIGAVSFFAWFWLFPIPLPKRMELRVLKSFDRTGRGIERIEYFLQKNLRHDVLEDCLQKILFQKYKDYRSRKWIEKRITELDGPPIRDCVVRNAARDALGDHLKEIRMTLKRFILLCHSVSDDDVADVYAAVLWSRESYITEDILQYLVQSDVHDSIQKAAREILKKREK